MVTTLDGKIKKRGEGVWEIGWDLDLKINRPSYSRVHQDLTNPNRCWASYEECLKECLKLNSQNLKQTTMKRFTTTEGVYVSINPKEVSSVKSGEKSGVGDNIPDGCILLRMKNGDAYEIKGDVLSFSAFLGTMGGFEYAPPLSKLEELKEETFKWEKDGILTQIDRASRYGTYSINTETHISSRLEGDLKSEGFDVGPSTRGGSYISWAPKTEECTK